jgi:hypothetical protein
LARARREYRAPEAFPRQHELLDEMKSLDHEIRALKARYAVRLRAFHRAAGIAPRRSGRGRHQSAAD